MPRQAADLEEALKKKGGLTLSQLANYDDLITDALVDRVYLISRRHSFTTVTLTPPPRSTSGPASANSNPHTTHAAAYRRRLSASTSNSMSLSTRTPAPRTMRFSRSPASRSSTAPSAPTMRRSTLSGTCASMLTSTYRTVPSKSAPRAGTRS